MTMRLKALQKACLLTHAKVHTKTNLTDSIYQLEISLIAQWTLPRVLLIVYIMPGWD